MIAPLNKQVEGSITIWYGNPQFDENILFFMHEDAATFVATHTILMTPNGTV